jgi:hypothetical protein
MRSGEYRPIQGVERRPAARRGEKNPLDWIKSRD